MDEHKKGINTTEGRIMALLNLAVILTTVAGHIPGKWGAVALVVANTCYALSRGMMKVPLVDSAPGASTSEFWTTVTSLGAMLLGAGGGIVSVPEAVAGSAVVTTGYSLSRMLAKADWPSMLKAVLAVVRSK